MYDQFAWCPGCGNHTYAKREGKYFRCECGTLHDGSRKITREQEGRDKARESKDTIWGRKNTALASREGETTEANPIVQGGWAAVEAAPC